MTSSPFTTVLFTNKWCHLLFLVLENRPCHGLSMPHYNIHVLLEKIGWKLWIMITAICRQHLQNMILYIGLTNITKKLAFPAILDLNGPYNRFGPYFNLFDHGNVRSFHSYFLLALILQLFSLRTQSLYKMWMPSFNYYRYHPHFLETSQKKL